MINYWKQFAAWAIGSGPKPLFEARLKAILFVLIPFLGTLIIISAMTWHYERMIATESMLERHFLEDKTINSEELQILNYIEAEKKWLIFVNSVGVGLLVIFDFALAYFVITPVNILIRKQKRFIADAAHELRTPLSIMKTNSEVALLDESSMTKTEAIATVKSNLEETNRLANILNNLLALSQFENTLAEMPFSLVDFSNTLARLLPKFESMAAKKHVNFSLGRSDRAMVWGNSRALEEMAANLIKNAIIYTQPGGDVSISLVSEPKGTKLMIKDTGMGIPAKDLSHIFEPFYRVDASRDSRNGGSGLGLSIAREIASKHNAVIDVKSEVDRGTVFTVSFPSN